MKFFTSDHHFGHANILKYQDKKRRNPHGKRFESVRDMDEHLIFKWNERIGIDDVVYCIGDISYKAATLQEYMPRLNGRKILIVGNHDPFFKRATTNCVEEAGSLAREVGFEDMHMALRIEIDCIGGVLMSHFPYWPTNPASWADYQLRYEHLRPARGSEKLLLHGHVHSDWLRYEDDGKMLNLSVDMWNMAPVSEEEIVAEFRRFG